MDGPRDAGRSRRVLRSLRLLSDENAAPSGLLLGVDSTVDVRRGPLLDGRCLIRGAVISSEFAPRGDDAVVVNRAARGARGAFYASAWAADLLTPPGLLLEDPSDLLHGRARTTEISLRTEIETHIDPRVFPERRVYSRREGTRAELIIL